MKILIVDDEINMLKTLGAVLRRDGHDIRGVSNASDALQVIETEQFDLILSDVKMPGISGLQFLETLRGRGIETPVIMMTAYGTIDDAVHAMKLGADDYVTKPFPMDEIKLKIQKLNKINALQREKEHLSRENQLLKEHIHSRFSVEHPIGNDPEMVRIWETIKKISDQKATVLITGESGSGKEVVARAIHYQGNRRDGPFVAVHCAALTPTLLESELFGHEKGAFTGATRRKIGRFELADNGTVFLDEVGEIPLEIQVKLLRVLQMHEIERVGGEESIRLNVRVIAATNRDLLQRTQSGDFREDLYYRLNVIHLHVPPLRERMMDIPALAEHFLKKISRETGKHFTGFTDDAMKSLMHYHWPGNVRELENAIERAVVLSSGPMITSAFFPHSDVEQNMAHPVGRISRTERELIIQTLKECNGNKAVAAQKLGIGRTTLWRKIKQYRISE